MIPVYQERSGFGHGDCAWACIASIFEVPLSDLRIDRIAPPCEEDIAKWTECRFPELKLNYIDWRYDYNTVPADPEWGGDQERWTYKVKAWEPPTDDYWIASVYSPALRRPSDDPYYPLPALHAVVYRGAEFVHDPNKYKYGPEDWAKYQPLAGEWWTPRA